jgi:hypothetical protein
MAHVIVDASQDCNVFRRRWSYLHGNLSPLAHLLRASDRVHWIRFHALPDSKRYAEHEIERQEILRRANILGTEILGADAACWLIQSCIEEYSTASWRAQVVSQGVCLRSPDPEDDFHWIISVVPTQWRPGAFNDLLIEVADERAGPVFWMNQNSNAIFAPYDGGFDLFPPSQLDVEHMRELHPEWLSSYPDGL